MDITSKTYTMVSGVIFALVALGHLIRLVGQESMSFGAWSIPLWISGVGLVVAGYLSYEGFRLFRQSRA